MICAHMICLRLLLFCRWNLSYLARLCHCTWCCCCLLRLLTCLCCWLGRWNFNGSSCLPPLSPTKDILSSYPSGIDLPLATPELPSPTDPSPPSIALPLLRLSWSCPCWVADLLSLISWLPSSSRHPDKPYSSQFSPYRGTYSTFYIDYLCRSCTS